MRKISLVIFSFALLSIAFSQECNNPLLSAYNLTSLDAPQQGVGYNWCSNLINGLSCCSNDTVNNFQNLLQELVTSLEAEFGARDQSLIDLRNNVLDPYQNAVSDLTDNDDQLNRLTSQNADVGNEIRAQWNIFVGVEDQLSDLDDSDSNTDNDNTDSDNDFFVYMQNLQVARRNCLNTVLDVQASLWCLACDANWSGSGVNEDGSVVLSDTLSRRIYENCYGYTVWSQVFNPLQFANQTIERVRNLNNYLRDYGNNQNVLNERNVSGDIYQPVNPEEKTVIPPPDCSFAGCNDQVLLLLSGGGINQVIAANGAGVLGGGDAILSDIIQGTVVPQTIVAPTVQDLLTEGPVNVVIQNGSTDPAWSPEDNWSGLNPSVSGDPAQVSGLQEDVLPVGIAGTAPGSWEGATAVLNGQGDVPHNTDTTDTDD